MGNMIPKTENALVLRTDFSDPAAWEKICAAIRKPAGFFRFRANVEFLEDRAYESISIESLLKLIPDRYNHDFICLVDQDAVRLPEHPILIVDLYQKSGRYFRAVPGEIQGIENNLSIANMDFEEFSGAVDEDGVFRGFPEG